MDLSNKKSTDVGSAVQQSLTRWRQGKSPGSYSQHPPVIGDSSVLAISSIDGFIYRGPFTADCMLDSNINLYSLMYSQLLETRRLLVDLPQPLLHFHESLHQELYRVVVRAVSLLEEPGDRSIPAKQEYFLEVLLDLRWWTWVTGLQVGNAFTNPIVYGKYFKEWNGILQVKFPTIAGQTLEACLRHLPSYGFELWQQGTDETLRELVQCRSMAVEKQDDGSDEEGTLAAKLRVLGSSYFVVIGLEPPLCRVSERPRSIEDYLTIDLTQDLLGANSAGYVIRSSCLEGNHLCALKRIHTSDEKAPDLARLWHPHVVHLMHYWREEGDLFLVMELMDGDLRKLIAGMKSKAGLFPFALPLAVDIMLQIAKGMLYLHEMGVSHPHLMCANVLFKAEEKSEAYQIGEVVVKLGGFGCSRTTELDAINRDVFRFGLTCLEILTGDTWSSEDSLGVEIMYKPSIPKSTPRILMQCIASCFEKQTTFSEVVMLILLAKCQVLQIQHDDMLICSRSICLERNSARNENSVLANDNVMLGGSHIRADAALFSRQDVDLHEMYPVHQLHPREGDGPKSPVRATIIFFHGLPKVPEEWKMTWLTRDNKLLWPQTWLPEDLCGNVCVLSVSLATPNMGSIHLHEISKKLLQALVLSPKWNLGDHNGGIVLVGHGFGGLIIKSLVVEAQSYSPKEVQIDVQLQEVMRCKNFLKSLVGIVFYSVPHSGTSMHVFQHYISECSNLRVLRRSSLLQSLLGDDTFNLEMVRLSVNFERKVPSKTKMLAFVEGKPMNKRRFLVTEESCQGQYGSWDWHKISEDNHFEVCRPDTRNHIGYKTLLLYLQQLMMAPCNSASTTPEMRRRLTSKLWGILFWVIMAAAKFKRLRPKIASYTSPNVSGIQWFDVDYGTTSPPASNVASTKFWGILFWVIMAAAKFKRLRPKFASYTSPNVSGLWPDLDYGTTSPPASNVATTLGDISYPFQYSPRNVVMMDPMMVVMF